MRERLLFLAEQRARLAAQARDEREHLAALLGPADAVGSMAQSVLRTLAEVRRHPVILAAIVLLLVALRPRRVFSMLVRGWSAWRLYRGASDWLQRFALSAGARAKPVR